MFGDAPLPSFKKLAQFVVRLESFYLLLCALAKDGTVDFSSLRIPVRPYTDIRRPSKYVRMREFKS